MIEVVGFLLERGASHKLKDYEGKNSVDIANTEDLARYILHKCKESKRVREQKIHSLETQVERLSSENRTLKDQVEKLSKQLGEIAGEKQNAL